MCQNLVFRYHRSSGVLYNHEAGVDAALGGEEWGQTVGQSSVDHTLGAALGNVSDFGACNSKEVECQRHRLAVEVSARDNVFIVEEYQRVVGDSVQLDFDFAADIFQSITDCTVNLWDAAQRVSVLYTVVLAVGQDFRAFGEQTEVFGDVQLTLVATNLVYAFVVCVEQAGQTFHCHRADDVSQLSSAVAVVPCQSADRGHRTGAVGHAKAFLADQSFQRLDAGFCHCFSAVHLNALINSTAFAEHWQGHVSQRSKVAGSAQRALLWNDRMHALVEHLCHHGNQQRTNAGNTAAQSVCTQQQHTADNLLSVRVTGSGAVAEDEVGGQGVGHIFRNCNAGKVAEAGGNAVGNALFGSDFFCKVTGFLHHFQRLSGNRYLRTKAGNRQEFVDGQAVAVDHDFFDNRWIHNHLKDTPSSLKISSCGPTAQCDRYSDTFKITESGRSVKQKQPIS